MHVGSFSLLLLTSLGLFAMGCHGDPALIEHQKTQLAKQEQIIAEMRDTMDEQGEVIVEQIQMMSEMQTTIDKQRTAMKQATETLRLCSETARVESQRKPTTATR